MTATIATEPSELRARMEALTNRLRDLRDAAWDEEDAGKTHYDLGYQDALATVLEWLDDALKTHGEEGIKSVDMVARIEHEIECYLTNIEDWIAKQCPECEVVVRDDYDDCPSCGYTLITYDDDEL